MAANALFQITRDQVITGAMQLTGELAKLETPDAQSIIDYTIFLQAMLKFWDVNGYKTWLYQTVQFNCVANKSSYTIGSGGDVGTIDRPTRIPQAFTMDSSGNKNPLIKYSKQQFENLTPNNQPGPANAYFYDLQLLLGVFKPWPVPTDTSRTYNIVLARPIADIAASGTATFDIPQEGFLALIWGLAEQIGPINGCEEKALTRIERKAPIYLDAFMDFSEEDDSVLFQPNPQGGFGYGQR